MSRYKCNSSCAEAFKRAITRENLIRYLGVNVFLYDVCTVCAHARRSDCALAPGKCHASSLPTSRKLHKFARLSTVWSYF